MTALRPLVNLLKQMVNKKGPVKSTILARLRHAAREGQSCSGSALSAELGISRVAIWKHLETLREAGYAILAEHGGYRLLADSDFLYPWEFPGRESRIVRYERTDSTMDRALERALRAPDSGAIVVAETQSAGRGRRKRPWVSSEGGLFATLVLSPTTAPWRAARASMAGGIALCRALREKTEEPFTLEWPNDVYLEGRKAAGLLHEYLASGETLRLLTLGLGVNVANPAPDPRAMSLSELPGPPLARRDLLSSFLDHFEALSLEDPNLGAAWNALSSSKGRSVQSSDSESRLGAAVGIDDEGNLVIEKVGGGTATCRPAEARIQSKEYPA